MADKFWTDPTASPKRSYRFMLSVGGVGTGNTWLVTQVKKPSATVGEISHKYLNHTFHYPGRVEWDTVNITLVDPVEPNAAGLMSKILEGTGYHVPQNGNLTTSITKEKAVNALGTVTITQFGNDINDKVEEWTLKNAFITQIDWGELNYESDDLTNITLTIRYDWAECQTNFGGTNRPAGQDKFFTQRADDTSASTVENNSTGTNNIQG